jgi:hypothetical protein
MGYDTNPKLVGTSFKAYRNHFVCWVVNSEVVVVVQVEWKSPHEAGEADNLKPIRKLSATRVARLGQEEAFKLSVPPHYILTFAIQRRVFAGLIR